MAESLPTITNTLEHKRTQAELNAALLKSIRDLDDATFDQALHEGADPFAKGIVWEGESEPSDQSLLHYAIDYKNLHAVYRLIKKGADPLELNVHGVQAIVRAVIDGHPEIVQAILENVSDTVKEQIREVAHFNGKTLLHLAILHFSSYGICFRSDWQGSVEFWNLMKDFYEQKPVTLPVDEEMPNPNYLLNIKLISVLVNAFGPAIWHQKDGQNATPLDIIQNPSKYRDRFTDLSGKKLLECLTSTNEPKNIEVFKVTFGDRSGLDPVVVNARVHFRHVQNLYIQHIEKYPEYFATYFKGVQHEEHQKLETRLEAAQAQMVDLKEQHDRLGDDQHRLELQQQQTQAQIDPMRAHFAAKQALNVEVDAIRKNAVEDAFYSKFHTKLPAELTGASALFSERVTRSDYSILDKASSLAGGAATAISIPIASTVLTVAAKAGQVVSDHLESVNNTNIATHAEGKHEKIARLAGVALVKHYRNHLAALKPSEAQNQAKKLGERAVEAARDALKAEGKIKPGDEESIASQLVEYIKHDAKFNKHLPILLVDPKQKDERARTVVSPGRGERKEHKVKESPERKGGVGGYVAPIVHSGSPPDLPPRVVVTPSAPPKSPLRRS